jgi:hypothetical protein
MARGESLNGFYYACPHSCPKITTMKGRAYFYFGTAVKQLAHFGPNIEDPATNVV